MAAARRRRRRGKGEKKREAVVHNRAHAPSLVSFNDTHTVCMLPPSAFHPSPIYRSPSLFASLFLFFFLFFFFFFLAFETGCVTRTHQHASQEIVSILFLFPSLSLALKPSPHGHRLQIGYK